MKKLIFFIIRISLIPFLIRELWQRKRVTIILYHDISPVLFERHIRQLTKKYSIIKLSDFVSSVKDGAEGALPHKSLIITFDDGHQGNFLLLDVLKKYGIPITIFLCSGIAGTNRHFWFKSLPPDTVQKLKRKPDETRVSALRAMGFDDAQEHSHRQALTKQEIYLLRDCGTNFQSHTIFHPILPQCGDQKARDEIALSKRMLENEFGFSVFAFSYPNGDYSIRDVQYACEAGYECALTIDPGYNTHGTDRFMLKRICLTDHEDINELMVRTSGVWDLLKSLLKIFIPQRIN
ncbi:MAG TPA: polysaccharide deacetylase family protein [Chitinivibrionales bacterium]|nr:polysaccharide deacetylase family protein [Chitinivibrionales bacterium]